MRMGSPPSRCPSPQRSHMKATVHGGPAGHIVDSGEADVTSPASLYSGIPSRRSNHLRITGSSDSVDWVRRRTTQDHRRRAFPGGSRGVRSSNQRRCHGGSGPDSHPGPGVCDGALASRAGSARGLSTGNPERFEGTTKRSRWPSGIWATCSREHQGFLVGEMQIRAIDPGRRSVALPETGDVPEERMGLGVSSDL